MFDLETDHGTKQVARDSTKTWILILTKPWDNFLSRVHTIKNTKIPFIFWYKKDYPSIFLQYSFVLYIVSCSMKHGHSSD